MARWLSREALVKRTALIEEIVMMGLAIAVPLATGAIVVWKLFDY